MSIKRFLTPLLIAVLLSWAAPAQATLSVNSLSLNVELMDNGRIAVNQELEFVGSDTLSWRIFGNYRNLSILADGIKLSSSDYVTNKDSRGTLIRSKTDEAQTWQISYLSTSALIRHDDRDQLFVKILDQPGFNINSFEGIFRLPSQSTSSDEFSGNLYAISGVFDSRTEKIDNRTISYSAGRVGPNSILTVNASWPKNILTLTKTQEWRLAITNFNLLPWLILGVALPILSILVLLLLIILNRSHGKVEVSEISAYPPSKLSPVLIGVLLDKKILPKEVSALLIDLCQRGYLVIIKKGGDFFFGRRRRSDENLLSWEVAILDELIPDSTYKISNPELKALSKQVLFSPKIKSAFHEIYEIVTKNNYFVENPHVTRIRYKLIGLAIYYFALIGVFWLIFSGGNNYLLVPLISTILIAWTILKLTPSLVKYSPTGLDQKKQWQAFANYLKQKKAIDSTLSRNQTYERFLPYAIVLNVSSEWSNRFDQSRAVQVRPDWFISYSDTSATEFADDITEFTTKISTILTDLKGPLVN